jgi:hypothetical protein
MFKKTLYGYPVLARHGLGNILFPWARCFVWCETHRIAMIAPQWAQLRIGPYLRREKDKRNYHFLFHNQGYITGIRRIYLLAFGVRIADMDISDLVYLGGNINKPGRPRVICFEGMGSYFLPIMSFHSELRSELMRITKKRYIIQSSGQHFIGIHVRRGDFATPSQENILTAGELNYRIPLEWYRDILFSLRGHLGNCPAIVFSDGTLDELSSLLSLPNITLCTGGSAIGDLLLLSNSSVMIASGSTYSMWASFLGQVPCVWYPGQKRQAVVNAHGSMCLEPEVGQNEHLPDQFLQAVQGRSLA